MLGTAKSLFCSLGSFMLMAIAWWDWPHAALRERMADFRGLGADAFAAKYA